MTSLQFSVILVAIWSIIPALTVLVVLWMRLLAAERRIEGLEIRKLDLDTIQSAISEVRNDIDKTKSKMMSVEESLGFINSKWNARLRHEQAAEKKRSKDKNNGSASGDDIEESEPAFPYQQALPLPAGLPTGQIPAKRRAFGQYPS